MNYRYLLLLLFFFYQTIAEAQREYCTPDDHMCSHGVSDHAPTPIVDIRIYPDVKLRKAIVHISIDNTLMPHETTMTVSIESFNTAQRHIMAIEHVACPTTTSDNKSLNTFSHIEEVIVTFNMSDEMLSWTFDCPQMYRLNIDSDKRPFFHAEQYFAMRNISAITPKPHLFFSPHYIELNGETVELHTHYDRNHQELSCLNRSSFIAWFNIMEKYKHQGINHVIFDTYRPTPDALLAADVVGIYVEQNYNSHKTYCNKGITLIHY